MQRINMRLRYVAVAKVENKGTTELTGSFVIPQAVDEIGIVRFVSSDVQDLKPGDRVYIGPKREPLRIRGEDLMVMEDSNVFGVVLDGEEKTGQATS